MGCLIPDHDTAMVLKKKFPVSRSGLPVKYSLLEYAPPAGNQNPYPNCTSWSTAYCAFTIVDRISSSNRYAEPFSAMDLHNRIMAYDGNQTCESGAAISTALHLLSQYGCLRSKSIGCSNVSATVNYPSKLYDYANVTVNVDDIKSAIVQKCPVVIAVETFSDDWQKSEYRPNNVWNGYYSGKTYKYHAMTVIGYDNNFAGGAFLVQNSWGDNWGENGRFWIRYRDITLMKNMKEMMNFRLIRLLGIRTPEKIMQMFFLIPDTPFLTSGQMSPYSLRMMVNTEFIMQPMKEKCLFILMDSPQSWKNWWLINLKITKIARTGAMAKFIEKMKMILKSPRGNTFGFGIIAIQQPTLLLLRKSMGFGFPKDGTQLVQMNHATFQYQVAQPISFIIMLRQKIAMGKLYIGPMMNLVAVFV